MARQTEPKPDESKGLQSGREGKQKPGTEEREPQSQDHNALQATNDQTSPTESGDSQSKESTDWIGFAVGAVVVAFFICSWIGWATVFTVLLWTVVVIAALAAAGLGAYALYSEDDKEKTGAWIGVGVSVVIAFAAWIFIPEGSGTEGSAADSTDAEAGLTPQQIKGRRTLAYWNGLRSALARTNSIQTQDPQQGLNILHSAIGEIDSTPAVGVDVDAIRCGSALRRWLGMVATEAQRRNSPELFVEAFARGYQGDVFGPLLELGQMNAAIQQSLAELQDQCAATRATLSARYDVEFPHL